MKAFSLLAAFILLMVAQTLNAQYFPGYRRYGYGRGYGYGYGYGYCYPGTNYALHFPGGFEICNPSPSDAWSSPYSYLYYLKEFERYQRDITRPPDFLPPPPW